VSGRHKNGGGNGADGADGLDGVTSSRIFGVSASVIFPYYCHCHFLSLLQLPIAFEIQHSVKVILASFLKI